MFYGSGAGKLPTASAVVADVVDAAKYPRQSCYACLDRRKGYADRQSGHREKILCQKGKDVPEEYIEKIEADILRRKSEQVVLEDMSGEFDL